MEKSFFSIALLTSLFALMLVPLSSQAVLYTETFEQTPGSAGYAALITSPNGVTYDWYPGRAFARLAPFPVGVLGTGDEAFYWGNNSMLPRPLYGEPGSFYCDANSTNYLFNGYGTGYPGDQNGNYVLGISFASPRNIDSADFGYAGGSNAPSHKVTMHGFSGSDEVWQASVTVSFGGLAHLEVGSSSPVDRITIERQQNTTAPFGGLPLGWYTMDNLSYEIDGDQTGSYSWQYYSQHEFKGTTFPAPEPATFLFLGSLLIALGYVRRKIT